MSPHRILVYGVGLYLIVCSTLWGQIGTDSSLIIPSAKRDDMGRVEFGANAVYTIMDNKYNLQKSLKFRNVLTNYFEFSIYVENDMDFLTNLDCTIYQSIDEKNKVNHYIGTGVKNLGWTLDNEVPASPVWGAYAVYTADYGEYSLTKDRNFYHLGFGVDQSRNDEVYLFAGANYMFEFGLTYFEWDGKSVIVGLKLVDKDQQNVYISASPRPVKEGNRFDNLLSIGISLNDNIYNHLKRELVLRKDYEAEITDLRNRMMVVEARDKAIRGISSLPFLENMEQLFLERKIQMKEMDDQSKGLVQSTAFHMQKGLEFYYKKEYARAIKEYETVIAILPGFSEAFVRLGSIYYQMGNKVDSIQSWQKALSLDPNNDQLKTFLKKILSKVEYEQIIQAITTQKTTKEQNNETN